MSLPGPVRAVWVVGLAVLAAVVFVLSVLALCIGLTVLCYLLLGGDCKEGCYSDVYLGFGQLVVTLAASAVLTAAVVRYAARRTRR